MNNPYVFLLYATHELVHFLCAQRMKQENHPRGSHEFPIRKFAKWAQHIALIRFTHCQINTASNGVKVKSDSSVSFVHPIVFSALRGVV
ncbi:MAG: hypothetical protein R8K53_01100 [Mariprofundaceae bacterium]